MKHLFFGIPFFCLIVSACHKTVEPPTTTTTPTPTPTCEIIANDTLMILYPCDGQTDFIPDSFSWQFGVVGAKLEGFVELHINKADPPYGLYSGFDWSDLGTPKADTTLTGAEIALLPYTTYEWFMVLRHDGNGLYYTTPKQTFTTGETGFSLPTVFQSFAGTFAVQDTFYERIQVWDSQSTYHLEDMPPVHIGSNTVTVETIPGEAIKLNNQDTITYVLIRIGQEDPFTVRINHEGSFYWSDGNYYSPTSVSGQVFGDSIVCIKNRTASMIGTYSGHAFKGKRE